MQQQAAVMNAWSALVWCVSDTPFRNYLSFFVRDEQHSGTLLQRAMKQRAQSRRTHTQYLIMGWGSLEMSESATPSS